MSNTAIVKFMELNADHELPDDPVPRAEPGVGEVVAPAETGLDKPVCATGDHETEPAWFPLDIRHVRLEQVTGVIFWIAIVIGGLTGFGIWYFASGADWIWWLSTVGAIFATGFLLWTTLYWPVIAHRHARWRLDETGLEIRRGVFWKHQISIPLARLQHADIAQGPFQRRFGLAKLTVHTAGTANASVELDGLAIETATWLRDMLIRQKEAQDVV